MHRFTFAFAALAITMLAACGVVPMEAKLAPVVAVNSIDVGHGRIIGVVVTDERPNHDLGDRSPAGGHIKMNQDLVAIYQTTVFDGLRRKGFAPVIGPGPETILRIEIRSLSYKASMGLVKGNVSVDSTAKAYVTFRGKPLYEHFYRSGENTHPMVVPGAGNSNAKLNGALSATIEQLLEDPDLLRELAASSF